MSNNPNEKKNETPKDPKTDDKNPAESDKKASYQGKNPGGNAWKKMQKN